ncbi:hypothetical protein GCWU000342_00071 [Shuttleworthella satelles DSM 14600]|uniref:Uncharacterized protein n=1 Tax=Shuttleworthella satelles DSM 14600 TaxID=626523 RepID=C4G8C4_9FIRM|nr:hypothetical protein GCWU000342_00071 [Shuttleworthia satelles DSM 14600]
MNWKTAGEDCRREVLEDRCFHNLIDACIFIAVCRRIFILFSHKEDNRDTVKM